MPTTCSKTGGKAKPKQGARKRATSQVDNDRVSKKQRKAAVKGDNEGDGDGDSDGEGKKGKKGAKRGKRGPTR